MRIPLLYILLLFYDWLLFMLLLSVFLPFFVCYIALTTVPTHLFAVPFTFVYFNDLCPEPEPPGRLIFHHSLRVPFCQWGGDPFRVSFFTVLLHIPRHIPCMRACVYLECVNARTQAHKSH